MKKILLLCISLFSFSAFAFNGNFAILERVIGTPPTVLPMMVGGSAADNEDFKYFARVMEFRPDGTYFSCGGSILSDRYILTAAHCIQNGDASEVKVLVKNMTEFYTDVEYKAVKNIYMHELWDLGDFMNGYDIAVLELEFPIYDNVASITLPTDSDETYYLSTGTWNITGRGLDETHTSPYILETVEARALSKAECSVYSLNVFHEDRMLCTQHMDFQNNVLTGVCSGDSGSPLTYRDNNGEYQAIGIASYAPVPCTADGPSVFTDIKAFVPWIQSKMTTPSNPMTYNPSLIEGRNSYGDNDPNVVIQDPKPDEDKDTNEDNDSNSEDQNPETGNDDKDSLTDDSASSNSGSSGGSMGFLSLFALCGLVIKYKKID